MTCVLGHRRIIMGRARAEASAEVVVRMVVSEESEKARAQPGNELELSGMDRKQEVSVTVADASDPANDFPFARVLGMLSAVLTTACMRFSRVEARKVMSSASRWAT